MARQTTRRTVARARSLRREMSLPEVLLWRELRSRGGGLKLRRQHPVGPFVADFYCASAKLTIEIDGIGHDMGDRPARDEAREAFLKARGLAVLRIAAKDVLRSPVAAAEAVVAECRKRGA